MSRMIIVVGDLTSGGGRVITGTPFTDIDGKPVARVSDKATCPNTRASSADKPHRSNDGR